MSEFTNKLKESNDETNDKIKDVIKKITDFQKNVQTIRKVGVRNSIIEDIISFLTNNNIIFNNNPYLYAFNNSIYDLKKNMFVKPSPKFYISKTTGYNYNNKYPNLYIKELEAIIDTILTKKEVKQYYLTVLSTGLCGIQLENCFITTGSGGNGKSLINSLMLKTTGTYGYKLPSHILLNEIKSGANPEVANMHGARFVLTQEPNCKRKINCSTLKEITGDKTLNVRDLYSSNCSINLNLTFVIEANEIPSVDEVNDAVNRRMRVIPFESKCVSKEDYELLEDKTNIFIANPLYKTDEFQDKYKQALFSLLLPYFKQFVDDKLTMPPQPKECAEKCKDFLATSDDIYSWFQDVYEKTENINESIPIPLSDIYDVFNYSDYFRNMSKNDKRKYNKKYFVEKIENNLFLRRFIKQRKSCHNKIKLNTNSLIGWQKISNDIRFDIDENIIN
jgi:P4 family phage/plasmid primase-like protien